MRYLPALLSICLAAGCLPEEPTDEDSGALSAPEEAEQGQDPAAGERAAKDDGPADVTASLAWDGVMPQSSSCWSDRRFVQSTHLRINGNGPEVSAIIYLYYSPSCRTTWARLTGGTVAVPNDNNGGIAKIIRNSDGRTYTCHVTTSSGECITAMVNDAGVTSYAYGYEDAGAWTAWARTASY